MSSGDEKAYPLVFSADSPMIPVYRTLERIRESPTTVLLEGESGTGKDALALWLHYNSPRKHAPFIKLDLSELPETFVDQELFGYEEGISTKLGKFDLARDGTVMIDEIASMDFSVQAKLLNIVEEKQFYRLGGTRPVELHARIVAVSRAPLAQAVDREIFRQDLFFRLNLITVRVPPLRQRRNEIFPMAAFLLEQFNRRYKRASKVHSECLRVFEQYEFPGNIRELRNALESAMWAGSGPEITPEALPRLWQRSPQTVTSPSSLQDLERNYIAEVLRQTHGKKVKAAQILGISRKTLLEKRKKYGIQ